jgi:hypothetical protein
MRTQKSILAHINMCSLKFLRGNYSNKLSLFKIVINIGVYFLYYVDHESIPAITEDWDNSYKKNQKFPLLKIQYYFQIKLYDTIVYQVFNIYTHHFHLNNIPKQIVVPTNF